MTLFRPRSIFAALAASALLAGCTVSEAGKTDTAAPAAAPAVPATTAQPADAPLMTSDSATTATAPATGATTMRVDVDIAARRLTLYDGDKVVETHPIAVGSAKWPTRTGDWSISQVVFNPEWIPPDESWAEERQPRKPGDPKNPLGRAQLIYDPPRTVHGTSDPTSIGKAVSHGSIRMRNESIVALGRKLMEATGAGRDDSFYSRVAANPTEKAIVDLPTKVPIRVH